MTLPTDYTNATPAADTHPTAHNDTNAAVNALLATTRLKVAPPGAWIPICDSGPWTSAAHPGGEIRAGRGFWHCTVDALSLEVTVVVVSTTLTVGIYEQSADGSPGALVAYSDPIESSGVAGVRTLPFNVPVPAGVYWCGILANGGGPTLRTVNGPVETLYWPTQPVGVTAYSCLNRTGLSALPDPFGTPVGVRAGLPICFVRAL